MARTAGQKRRQVNAKIARMAAQLAVHAQKRSERNERRRRPTVTTTTHQTFRDPISMENVPIERGVLLNRQMYDPAPLAEWLERSHTLPHSRRALTNAEISMVQNMSYRYDSSREDIVAARREFVPDIVQGLRDLLHGGRDKIRCEGPPGVDYVDVLLEWHTFDFDNRPSQVHMVASAPGVGLEYNFDTGILDTYEPPPGSTVTIRKLLAVFDEARRQVPESRLLYIAPSRRSRESSGLR